MLCAFEPESTPGTYPLRLQHNCMSNVPVSYTATCALEFSEVDRMWAVRPRQSSPSGGVIGSLLRKLLDEEHVVSHTLIITG